MGTITIVGLGPGAAGNLSLETMDLLKSEAQVILRTAVHPTVAELEKQNVKFTSCDSFYEEGANFEEVYGRVVARVLAAAMEGDVVYAVPGSPLVAERTVVMLREQATLISHVVSFTSNSRGISGNSFNESSISLAGAAMTPSRSTLST